MAAPVAAARTRSGFRWSEREPRFLKETGVLLILVLLGFGLRVLRLSFQPLWWDEGYSVWFATHPLGQMAALTAQDIHPPLYYALLRGWTLLLGTGPVVLRLLSVIIGTATIPLIYVAGRRMFSPRAAVLAALLLAINPLATFYSQEVRMYGLVALLSAGILLVAWRVLGCRGDAIPQRVQDAEDDRESEQGERGAGWWMALILYIFLTAAVLYTQYYAIFLPVGLTVFAIWQWWRDRVGRKALDYWLGAQAAVALLYLPWIIYAGPKLVPYVSQKVVMDADRPPGLLVYLGRHLSAFLAGHLEGPLAPYWPAALVLLIPLAIGLGAWLVPGAFRNLRPAPSPQLGATSPEPPTVSREPPAKPGLSQGEGGHEPSAISHQPSAILMLLFVLLMALLLGWLVALRYPFFPDRGERLLLLASPALLLLAAAGLDALISRARIAGYVTLALIGAVSVANLIEFYTVPRYADDDYRPLIARIVEQGLPGDTVFAIYPWQVGYWRAYGDAAGPTAILTPKASWGAPVLGALDAALAQGRVWFPAHMALGAKLESRVEDYLRARSIPFLNEWHGPNTRLSAWDAVVSPGTPVNLSPVRFPLPGQGAGAVELVGATAAPDPVPAANAVLPLTLRWQSEAPSPVLDVSVRLVDDIGQTWGQHDYEPLGQLGLPSGSDGESCAACAGDSTEAGKTSGPWDAQDRLGLLIPAGTPPGRYHTELVIRPKGEERPLDATAADGRSLGASARLFDITVTPANRVLGDEHLPVAFRRAAGMQDGLRFLGYSADETPATPGEMRKVNLFWQAVSKPAADYVAFVQLLDRQGRVAAGWEAPPGASYSTKEWAPGTLMRTQAALRIPANLSDGTYRLIAGLFRAKDKARLLTLDGQEAIELGKVAVRGRPHQLQPPNPMHGTDIRLGDLARLVGYDMALPGGGVSPGGSLPLTLYWQAQGTNDRSYAVFVHLLDEAGAIRGYGDSEPASGQLPTSGWLPGEYLTDPHEVVVSSDAPPGTYRLAVGMYDPATGQRLTAPDGADQIVLDTAVQVGGG